MVDAATPFSAGRCDGCGTERGPLVKMSLGKDFFSRAYDRLSPSFDQSPKWYCNHCSMHKNLQRDFRDIRIEFDRLTGGQSSELSSPAQFHRAQLRLREITAILAGYTGGIRLIDPSEVSALLQRMQSQPVSPSPAR
jgi:hypothetical protein